MSNKTVAIVLAIAMALITFGVYRTLETNKDESVIVPTQTSIIQMPTGGESEEGIENGDNE